MSSSDSPSLIFWFVAGQPIPVTSAAEVGGKGANLVESFRAGLPVPPGFCLTADAYRRTTADVTGELVAHARNSDAGRARKLVEEADIPDVVTQRILDAYRLLGSPLVAVRSSATAEDLETASFAGQQDTILGVIGEAQLIAAIRTCWASLWTDRAVAYRNELGFDHGDVELAVVVQVMVASEVAGVLFTADPVSSDPGRMLVSASYGLGESVAASVVTPDTYTIDARGNVIERTIGSKETRIDLAVDGGTSTSAVDLADQGRPCLSEGALKRLADLGRRLEGRFKSPQDVEWAFAGNDLYLLQSRPITTHASSAVGHGPARSHVLRVLRDDLIEHYPAPYPLDVMAVRRVQVAIQSVLRSLGVRTPPVDDVIRIDDDGNVGIHASWPRPTPAMLWRVPATMRAAIARDSENWSTDEPRFRNEIAALERRCGSASTSSDGELIELVQDAVHQAADLTRLRFLHYLMPMMVRRSVATALIRAARMTGSVTAEDLFADLDYVTAVVGREIVTLRARVERDGLASALRDDTDPRCALLETAPGRSFLDDFDASLTRIGASTSRMYLPFSNRSWRERPRQLMDLIAVGLETSQPQRPPSRDAGTLVAERLPGWLRGKWELTVQALRDQHIGREGTLYLIEEVFVLARYGMDEIARRVVDRGVIDDADDIRFATFEEVRAALLDPAPASLSRVVARRQRMRGRAEAHWWDRGPGVDSAAELRGLAASPGRAIGTARVIDGPASFGLLKTGEVLVCRFTDPTWTPLFAFAAAVVADAGGPLSHAAIVAREYGIPAVLGARDATTRLQSGQRILVNGDAGTVEILTEPAPA